MSNLTFPGMAKYKPRESTEPGHKRQNPEEMQCRYLVQWRDAHRGVYPLLHQLVHIPNGAFMPKGEAGKMVGMGMTRGVFDFLLAEPRFTRDEDGAHYNPMLWLEMKIKPNKLTPEQEEWRDRMEANNSVCLVAYDWLMAARAICDWLEIRDRRVLEGIK